MKINKLKINGYGKLKNKEMEFNKGINIIYGENESGKSTLLNYITNSLYGISKNKNKKEFSDFEKYTPWNGEEFSGTLEYELDNNQKFQVFREFRKKNPTIYNDNMEDISKEFNIDKTKGNQFFYDQTNIDEELFKSTFLVGQQEVKLESANQQMLVQKISNLVGTGEDNISYKLAMDRLNRKLLDEVGTQRSREKPINVISKKIENIENELTELSNYENLKYEIDEKKSHIQNEIEELETKNNLTKEIANEIKKLNQKEFLENEKVKLQENLKNENDKKINELKVQEEEIKNKENNILEENKKIKNKIKKLNKKIIIILFIIILLNILQFIFIKNKLINYIFLLTVPIVLIFYYFLKNKLKNKLENKKIEEIKTEKNKIKNEKNIIEENNKKIKNEIIKIKEKNNLEYNLEKEKLKNKYKGINFEEINIEKEVEVLQSLINRKKLETHQCDLDKENIEPKLDCLSKLQEQLVNDKQQYVNIANKGKSIELAKEVLTNAYEKMKQEVTPKFTSKLSENIGIITKGKYSRAMYNEEKGLIVELKNGNYVTANKLSIGTIDQLYLSLRLSMVEDLSKETIPIILDESFAYFDNDRLENILTYLAEQFENRQILIFTCTNREMDILKNKNIKFNIIEL